MLFSSIRISLRRRRKEGKKTLDPRHSPLAIRSYPVTIPESPLLPKPTGKSSKSRTSRAPDQILARSLHFHSSTMSNRQSFALARHKSILITRGSKLLHIREGRGEGKLRPDTDAGRVVKESRQLGFVHSE